MLVVLFRTGGEIPTSSSAGRQDAHQLPPGFRADDVLKQNVDTLWKAAVSVNTRAAYQSGIQCLLTFLTMSGVLVKPGGLSPITEDSLIYFVSYCHSALHLKWTIKLYLSGIRFHYLQAGYPNPLLSVDRLQCILRGIKRTQVNLTKPRLPITIHILHQICILLRHGVFRPEIDKTLECMCCSSIFWFPALL